jgi:endonuclease/exonuclease/phosphatase family metal-dependent hydrolase
VRPLRERIAHSERFAHGESGTFSLAVISRLPLSETRTVWLSSLPRDQVRRAILSTSVQVNDKSIRVFGTHMAHLSQGSPRHFRVFRQAILASLGEGSDVIAGGDMNAWGPLVAAHLRPLRRAVKAKTWPSWGPHSQVDHLLASAHIQVLEGRVALMTQSDHLPVVAKFRLKRD